MPQGYDPATATMTCKDVQAKMKAVGKDIQPGTRPPFLDYYYQCIYKPMVVDKSTPLKMVVWRRAGTFGWGNQIRAQYGAFVLAMVTGRVFAVDDKMFDFYFHNPPSMTWKYSKLAKGFLNKNPVSVAGSYVPDPLPLPLSPFCLHVPLPMPDPQACQTGREAPWREV